MNDSAKVPHKNDWCGDYRNVTELGQWLIDNDRLEWDEGSNTGGLQYYYEKPYKWTDEYNEMREGQ